MIDPEKLNEVQLNLPDCQQRDFQFIEQSEAIPLGIFRYQDNFLLCYDKFAFMITTHGELIKNKYKRIEWESDPQSVAFYYPYVLAFDHNFIEIRHVETVS